VFRCVQLLLQSSRFDDALLVAQTCLKLDSGYNHVMTLKNAIQEYKKHAAAT